MEEIGEIGMTIKDKYYWYNQARRMGKVYPRDVTLIKVPIVTEQMVRDHLTFKGPMSVWDLTESLDLDETNVNLIQRLLLSLEEIKVVEYNKATGQWVSNLVLE